MSSLNTLGLVCSSYLHYLRFDGWTSSSTLGLAWLSDLHYLWLDWLASLNAIGLGWLPSPSAMSLACLSSPCYLGLGYISSLSTLGLACLPDPHYLISSSMPKGRSAFPWTCQGRMVIYFGVTRDYGNSLTHAKGGWLLLSNPIFDNINAPEKVRNENERRINWSLGQDNTN